MDTLVLKRTALFRCGFTGSWCMSAQDGIIPPWGAELSKDEVVIFGGPCFPGWIDLHTHIYYGGTDMGLKVEEVGLATGVHVLADAGSAGEANFAGFRAYVASSSESIKAFINLGSIGLVAGNRVKELFPEGIYPERLSAVIEETGLISKVRPAARWWPQRPALLAAGAGCAEPPLCPASMWEPLRT